MTPQTPAQGILMNYEYPDTISFHVPCECGNSDDSLDFYVEFNEDSDDVVLNIETKQKTDWYSDVVSWNPWKLKLDFMVDFLYYVESFVNGLFRRIKLTKEIWISGYAEYYHTTIMDKQTAINFAGAIVSGIEKLESAKENKNAK